MSLHTWCCQSPCKPSSCATSPSTLTRAELPQAKKVLCLNMWGRFGSVLLFPTLETVACQAFLSGSRVLQARIQERVGQYWFPWLCGTGVALRRYPTSKVREAQQDGGAGVTLRRYPMSKGREAPARH